MKSLLLSSCLIAWLAGSALARDNGDGTYSNPMIHADYPDSEVIRVGRDYFYQSSGFHWIPGNPVLKSQDLVNWKPAGFTVPNYKWDKRYELDGGDGRYGAGSWAPTLRYHDGMFYSGVFVWTEGHAKGTFVVSRSKSIEGPWKINLIEEKLYDPGLFFDDDGRVYVFHGQNDIFVTELDKDLRKVITPAKKIYSARGYFEGTHAYKIKGMYYLFNTGGGKQQCLRSKTIEGPYEHKTVCVADLNFPGSFLHQGGLVDTPGGEWWAIIFQDRGKHGRLPFLLPVKWEDGWPMVRPLMTCKKPNIGGPSAGIGRSWRSDDFSGPKLGLQWQWNHHPVDTAWSLTERSGFLRLHTTRVTDVLRRAQNTLAQQMFGPDSGAVVKLDVAKMKNGDFAGLGLFSKHCTSIGVVAKDDGKHLAVITEFNVGGPRFDKQEAATAKLEGDTVWLRAEVPYLEYAVNYSYSSDGKTFTPLGEKLGTPYDFFSDWLAPRYCIYNYATKETGGHVDVDSFNYIPPKRQNNLYAFGDKIDTQFYDEIDNPQDRSFKWVEDGMPNIFLQTPPAVGVASGKHGPLSWTAAFEANQPGRWVKFNRVDFGNNAGVISLRAQGQGKMSVHLDSEKGPVLAEGPVSSDTFTTLDLPLRTSPQGVHPIAIVFTPEGGKSVVLRQLSLK